MNERLTNIIDSKLNNSPVKITGYQKQFFENNPDVVWPLCKCGCGRYVLLNISEPKQVFREYGTPECSRKSKTVSKEVLDKLSDYNFLYEQRITLKKSKELIAEELGISITPVNKWIKIHNIPVIKYNESNPEIKQILDDKDKLEEDYNSGKKLSELAEIYGTSKATLSIFMRKFGIEMRNPNSYEKLNKKSSTEEIDLLNNIKHFYDGEIISGSFTIIPPFQLDIFIPDKKIAIEYNGLYSHAYRESGVTISASKNEFYHINKTNMCNDKDIQLIHVYADQWKYKKDIVLSIIKSKLGLNEKIYARKCQVKQISLLEKTQFLNENHIQGTVNSKIYYGLYHSNELVAVMTFGISRFNKKYTWELLRFSSKRGYTIVGGFSKLLGYFRKTYTGSIISYADRTYSNGNVYIKNGFTLLSVNPPAYSYINSKYDMRINRQSLSKKRILELLGIPSSDRSERIITEEFNIPKIYDCGTLTYVLK